MRDEQTEKNQLAAPFQIIFKKKQAGIERKDLTGSSKML